MSLHAQGVGAGQSVPAAVLHARDDGFRELLADSDIGYHEIDASGHIIDINHTELGMLGYSLDERHLVVGRQFWEFVHEPERQLAREEFARHSLSAPCTFLKKNGTPFPVHLNHCALATDSGDFAGLLCTVR